MRTTILVVALVLNGCAMFQAPPEVQVLTPVAGSEIKNYQRQMGGVAISTTNAYETSETTRLKDNHWRRLSSFDKDQRLAAIQAVVAVVEKLQADEAAKKVAIEAIKKQLASEAFDYLYVKAQTIVLLDKLSRVHVNTEAVKAKITELNIHIDRAIQILEMFNEWMKTGFTKGDAESVKRFFEDKSEEWLKLEKDKALAELQAQVDKLNAQLAEQPEEEAPAAPPAEPSR